jgi:teichuronic acid biosynthesis glycosyltransferase TuaH
MAERDRGELNHPDRAPWLVMCVSVAWDGPARAVHMLASELSRQARILWVDPPVSPVTRNHRRHGAGRLPRPRLRPVAAGIQRLTPTALPFFTRAGIRRTTPGLVRAQTQWALRRLSARPYAVLDFRLGGMLGGWGPGVHNVLYGTDDYVAGASLTGNRVDHLLADERRALAAADTVIAVSPTLAQRWRGMGAEVTVVPNGAAVEHYAGAPQAEPAAGVDLPGPVAGLVGHLSARIDIGLIEAVAQRCSLLMVGSRDPGWEPERFARLLTRDTVRWVDRQPYQALPGYLRRIDVGIVPYVDTAFNRASFPLKTLEYLAAGRPVVSTDLPATRWLGTDLIRIADGPAGFAAAVREVAAGSGGPELVAACQAFAREHSWQARGRQVAEAIGLLAATGADGAAGR